MPIENTTKEIAEKIASRIIRQNPSVKPHFQPYIKQKGIGFTSTMGFIKVDLKQFYPQAQKGNTAFIVCKMRVPQDSPMGILVNGNVKVWFNKECIFSSLDGQAKGENGYSVNLIDAVKRVTGVETAWYAEVAAWKDGDNELIIEAICGEDDFEFDLNVSHPKNITVWPTDYLIWMREESPLPQLQGEEGMAVSALFENAEIAEELFLKKQEYAYPVVQEEGLCFDLNQLYEEGNIAYAYTEAVTDGEIVITAHAPLKVVINENEVAIIETGTETISCKQGDKVLIRCLRKKKGWGFSVKDKQCLGLPFVKMSEKRQLTFLFCGPFYNKGLHTKLAPEYKIIFSGIYKNEKLQKVYWRFFPDNTYLRAYLNSCYYGQWYYAGMLCFNGLYKVAGVLDLKEYDEFFYDAMHQMAEYADYVKMDRELNGSAAFMPYSMEMKELDNIGVVGVNFAEAYFKSADTIFVPVLERLRQGIDTVVSRFDDGTFCRRESNTMWADDLFMSCPFLVRMAQYTGKDKYYQEAIAQIKGFVQRLYMPEKKIFSHIYFIKEDVINGISWGRGNGWIAYAISEVLLHMPMDTEGREYVLSVYKEFMQGICAYQDECGLWHQIINQPNSYLETSGTAMFMIAILRGVRLGWLDKSYLQAALRAWEGMKKYCIDDQGSISGICMGSSCSMEVSYYEKLPVVKDDDHGTGVVLIAICELIMMGMCDNADRED